jgi:hypothetical protein
MASPTPAPGGFVEPAVTAIVRGLLSPFAARVALPARGRFTFPAPYSTEGVRLTNASDCGGGDCVRSVGYSYWRSMNNHVGQDEVLIAITLDRQTGGGGPTLFSYDKATGVTRNRGPLFDAASRFSWATGEGWYFSATQPHMLYVNDGPRMLRYDVIARTFTTVMDVRSFAGPNRVIWQMHSSNDDAVHSFTVRDTSYAALGCGAYLERLGQYRFFPAVGTFDECQVEKSGRFLVIKENWDGRSAEDNVVEDLNTGAESVLADEAGALGHSDLGFGYGVGEDNWNARPGAIRVWQYDGGITPGPIVFQATNWGFGANHITHANARAGVPIDRQVACSSNASRLRLPHTNEIVCYPLDGSMRVLVVAPVMTDLDAAGGGSGDYEKEPKGNLDVTGEYFLWTSNAGTNRQDAFLVRVPIRKLFPDAAPSSPADVAGPVEDRATMPEPAPFWTGLTNVTLTASGLRKTAGCDGCPDAGAVSLRSLTAGDGAIDLAAGPGLHFIGLSSSAAVGAGQDLPFSLRIEGASVEVREYGRYRADVRAEAGDVLRLAIVNGRVVYARNGVPFYTSTLAPTYPLRVSVSIYAGGATVHTPLVQGW